VALGVSSVFQIIGIKRRLIVIWKIFLLFAKFWKCFWADALHSATMTKINFFQKNHQVVSETQTFMLIWNSLIWAPNKTFWKKFYTNSIEKKSKIKNILIVFCEYFFWTFVNDQCNELGISIKFWGQISTFCKFYTSIWCSPELVTLCRPTFPKGITVKKLRNINLLYSSMFCTGRKFVHVGAEKNHITIITSSCWIWKLEFYFLWCIHKIRLSKKFGEKYWYGIII
jgi:hypothetical protein